MKIYYNGFEIDCHNCQYKIRNSPWQFSGLNEAKKFVDDLIERENRLRKQDNWQLPKPYKINR